MFVQHSLRFTKRCHCGTKNKSMGDIFDKRKQTLHKRVYSESIETRCGDYWVVCVLGVSGVCREEVLISLPRKVCNRFLKLFSRAAVIN